MNIYINYSQYIMTEFFLKNLFIGTRKLVGLKGELSKSSPRVIIPKSSYPLIRVLFFNKKLCYKRSIDENLDRKVTIGFWCKQQSNSYNSLSLRSFPWHELRQVRTKWNMVVSYMYSHCEGSLDPVAISYFSLQERQKTGLPRLQRWYARNGLLHLNYSLVTGKVW